MKYNIEDIVFLKTDPEQLPRIVTGVLIRKDCCIYYLTNNISETSHYDFEISTNMNELIKLFN